MPASDARIRANQANSLKSTGPRTPEGKEASRANSYKHGLTGAGIVMTEPEAAEVARRAVAFHEELGPSGLVGQTLVRRAALLSVRMERCGEHEMLTCADRVCQAIADFKVPEGVDAETASRLRAEAAKIAMFDTSKQATLARKYEAAAERGFFRALKELRVVEKQAKAKAAEQATEARESAEALASFARIEKKLVEIDARYPGPSASAPSKRPLLVPPPWNPPDRDIFDVPITIGRRR